MGQNRSARSAVRPKPNEGHGVYPAVLHTEQQSGFEPPFHSQIDRPGGKGDPLPSPEIHPLKESAERNREKGTHGVIEFAQKRVRGGAGKDSMQARCVALMAKVVDQLIDFKVKLKAGPSCQRVVGQVRKARVGG